MEFQSTNNLVGLSEAIIIVPFSQTIHPPTRITFETRLRRYTVIRLVLAAPSQQEAARRARPCAYHIIGGLGGPSDRQSVGFSICGRQVISHTTVLAKDATSRSLCTRPQYRNTIRCLLGDMRT